MSAPKLVNDAEVLKLWKKGKNTKAIAAHLGVGHAPINRAMNRLREAGHDIPRWTRPSAKSKDPAMVKRDAEIRAMAKAVGAPKTAEHFGLTHQRVTQIAGGTGRPVGRQAQSA